jgi:hypothetical protein
MKNKRELPAERRVLKLKRETVRLLDLKAADLKTVVGGVVQISKPSCFIGTGCG